MAPPPSLSEPSTPHLRAAHESDAGFFFALRAAAIAPLWRTEFGTAAWIERYLHGPPEDFQPKETRIAMFDSTRVGILQMAPWKRALTIRWLIIEPAFQGRGIGTDLIHLTQNEAREQDRYVLLEVLRCNVDATRLYERLGFSSAIQLPHSTWMQWPARRTNAG